MSFRERPIQPPAKAQTLVLEGIRLAQSGFIANETARQVFESLLSTLLDATGSEYGFIGQILHSPAGAPYLKNYAVTNIAWNEETRAFYEKYQAQGLEFHNMGTLFGWVILNGEPLISNDPKSDPRGAGRPPGHPAMSSFLGLPFHHGTRLVGMAGVANRPGGYDQRLVKLLRPFLLTCGSLIDAYREQERRRILEDERAGALSVLRATLDATGDGILVADLSQEIVDYNTRFLELWGVECMDTTLREPGALRSRILAQVAGPEEFTERILWLYSHPEESATDVVRLLDGRVLERFTQPQRMGSTIVGRVWSYRDVTGREAALEARSHFLAGVSHEIRTPLTGMISAADLLERTPLSEDQRLLAESLKSSGRHLLVLINDLLDAARLEASSFTVDTFPFQPEELLGEVAALVRPSFEEASLRFEVRRPLRKPPSVHGDPARIRQILINLLSNARRFTSDGGVEVSLDWTLAADRLELRFCVSDSGPGIVPADRERIFEAFYQSRNTQLVNQMQGSGLGLAISRGLAERMGGRLFLDATGPSGSVFALELTLPVATQTVPPGLDADVRVRPASILLADDHDENRRLLARLIGEGGHTVREVSDGRAAIEAATTQDFDLILMDLQMPGMDGLEATRAIRARLRHHVPIIALTAHATDEFRRRCLEAGMDDHLAKPFSQFLLLRTLSKWIGSAEPDPVIADLVPGYLAARKDEIVLLEARLREKDLAAIRKIAHNLKGTGAGYGFPAFSQIGAELEAAAMEGNEDDLAGTLRRYRHALNKIEQSSSKTE